MALVVVVAGGAITLGLDQLWIVQWSKSGLHFPVGERQAIVLPAGQSLVYYESPHSIPFGRATMQLYDPSDKWNRVSPYLEEDINFRIRLTGLSGRAMWKLDIEQDGEYRFLVTNEDVLSDDAIPPEDQVVFFKSPETLREARFVQNGIRMTGASLTFVIMIICYLVHLATVSKHRGTAEDVEQFEGEFELEP